MSEIIAQDISDSSIENPNKIDVKNEANIIIKLKAKVDGNIVTLNWDPIPGEISILSSRNPITTNNWPSADKIAVVSGEEKTWSTLIEHGQNYYFALMAKNMLLDDQPTFIPLENTTLIPVFLEGTKTPQIALFSSFDVVTRNDAVILTWKPSMAGKNLVLYRSTSPFINLESLVQSIPVSSFQDNGVPFVDYPVPGISYYYTILDEDAIRTGAVSFEYGINTNRIPIEIPSYYSKIQRKYLPSVRAMPLPWLNPYKKIEPLPVVFSPTTNNIITTLVQNSPVKKPIKRNSFIFAFETQATGGGEEFALRKIIETYFMTNQWEATEEEIDNFLSIRRTAETAARARFYLGQTFFFRGEYTKALLEFLLSQDTYYNKSREWIEYTMENLQH